MWDLGEQALGRLRRWVSQIVQNPKGLRRPYRVLVQIGNICWLRFRPSSMKKTTEWFRPQVGAVLQRLLESQLFDVGRR